MSSLIPFKGRPLRPLRLGGARFPRDWNRLAAPGKNFRTAMVNKSLTGIGLAAVSRFCAGLVR
jgi:hypothetical protein